VKNAIPRWLLAPNPSVMTLDGTRTYIIGEREPVVIDPGPDIAAHVAAIVQTLDGAVPSAILLTHSHADHGGGAAALSRATGAPVRMAPGAPAGSPAGLEIERFLEPGELLATDAGVLRIVPTPGHTPEHVAIHWTLDGEERGGAVFVGDLMMGEGDTALVAPPEGNLLAYLNSLTTVESLAPERVYPAHGPPIDDPGEAVNRYRRHRETRIDQVRAALEESAGPVNPGDLVRRIYGDGLDPRLRRAAAGSIQAIIHYLEGGE
jgi:glyoxylase-like metal-dependent hydrolase (beta-lactamase superfamily II)